LTDAKYFVKATLLKVLWFVTKEVTVIVTKDFPLFPIPENFLGRVSFFKYALKLFTTKILCLP
jgi:hypothetical protein